MTEVVFIIACAGTLFFVVGFYRRQIHALRAVPGGYSLLTPQQRARFMRHIRGRAAQCIALSLAEIVVAVLLIWGAQLLGPSLSNQIPVLAMWSEGIGLLIICPVGFFSVLGYYVAWERLYRRERAHGDHDDLDDAGEASR